MTDPALFLLAVAILVAIPGPNHLYILARSVGEGRAAGLASAVGVEAGTLIHATVAAAGLSAVVATSSTALRVVRYAGAAYLVYLGIRTLRRRGAADQPELEPQPLRRVFLDGVAVNLLNPKVIVFFLAFLPQFVDERAGAVPLQLVVLGLVVTLVGLLSDVVYALAGGSLGSWMRSRPTFRRRQASVTGAVYIGLGATAALAGPGLRRS